MCEECGCQTGNISDKKIVEVNRSLLEANQEIAHGNRQHIERLGAKAINIISSPGAGKTTLLEATADALSKEINFAVIEGDIETEKDADRIRARGIPAVQLTTGGECHLDASLVHKGIHQLEHVISEGGLDLLFIENVGNLVCPAAFDLGEHKRVVMVSVPEGSDKPAKYPRAFIGSDLFIISKTDLLPYFDFSVEEASKEARRLNPDMEIITLSAVTGQGMDHWVEYLGGMVGLRP